MKFFFFCFFFQAYALDVSVTNYSSRALSFSFAVAVALIRKVRERERLCYPGLRALRCQSDIFVRAAVSSYSLLPCRYTISLMFSLFTGFSLAPFLQHAPTLLPLHRHGRIFPMPAQHRFTQLGSKRAQDYRIDLKTNWDFICMLLALAFAYKRPGNCDELR